MDQAIFIDNKYTKWYFQLIEKARNTEYDGYTETHHIVPKSLGGTDEIENLIKLSAREHFICHLLLTKMVDSYLKSKMYYSLSMMRTKSKNHQRDFKINSRIFEMLKIELSNIMKEKWTVELKAQKSLAMTGQNNHFYGKKHKPETLEKLKNKKVSEKTRQLISMNQLERFKNQPGTFLGKRHSEETRKKMSLSASKPKSDLWKSSASNNRKGKVPHNKGKTYEEIYGIEKASDLRKKIRRVGEHNGFYGKTHSDEFKEKKRQEKLATPKKICYFCGKEVDHMNYSRWHGDRCKSKK